MAPTYLPKLLDATAQDRYDGIILEVINVLFWGNRCQVFNSAAPMIAVV